MGGSSGTKFGRWGRQLERERKERLAKELSNFSEQEIDDIAAKAKEIKSVAKKQNQFT